MSVIHSDHLIIGVEHKGCYLITPHLTFSQSNSESVHITLLFIITASLFWLFDASAELDICYRLSKAMVINCILLACWGEKEALKIAFDLTICVNANTLAQSHQYACAALAPSLGRSFFLIFWAEVPELKWSERDKKRERGQEDIMDLQSCGDVLERKPE
ncbi:uncharacterized protein FA14DRAFT_153292 [Meira miltonrushii]|uniref:Uncharacterized protein n=1 Tax=Meira miltonrushii TaxID=1280837 RepID=A0A316VJT7_9BASI|nr:uncharacterized protein FA14DRAFT_153292 [Meira miltonrushii]PWN37947.1 hypothetical protein FA14DRAFT_153292 [Meira miltonrushii]